MTFRRAQTFGASAIGGAATWLLEHAVEPRAHAEAFLIGFEVDVGRAALDRVQHNLVDEAHHRCIVYIAGRDLFGKFVFAAGDVEALEIEIVLVEIRHRRVDRFQGPVDDLVQLVLLDHDRVDAEAGLELDLVDRLQVGRIGDTEEHALAATDQWQHAVLGEQLLVYRLDDVEVDLEHRDVQQRDAELVRCGNRDLSRIGQFLVDQVTDQALAFGTGVFDSLQADILGEDAILTSRRGRPVSGAAVAETAMSSRSLWKSPINQAHSADHVT